MKNLLFLFLNSILITLVFSQVNSAVLTVADRSSWSFSSLLKLSTWVRSLFLIILFDLWMYLWHRMNHEVNFFWRFHRMHHSDPEMDVTTAVRFHPGEMFMSSILRLGIFLILGMYGYSLFLYELFMMPVIYLQHSNWSIPEKADRILRQVIATPRMHWVHHSQLQSETDSNYGTIFSWWDRIFKTLRLRKDPLNIQYGLKEFKNEEWQTVIGLFKTPFIISRKKGSTISKGNKQKGDL